MRTTTLLLFTFALMLVPMLARASGEANPLLALRGKPYADYHDDYFRTLWLVEGDSLDRAKISRWLREMAEVDKSPEWRLNVRLQLIGLRYLAERNGGYVADSVATQRFLGELADVARELPAAAAPCRGVHR